MAHRIERKRFVRETFSRWRSRKVTQSLEEQNIGYWMESERVREREREREKQHGAAVFRLNKCNPVLGFSGDVRRYTAASCSK